MSEWEVRIYNYIILMYENVSYQVLFAELLGTKRNKWKTVVVTSLICFFPIEAMRKLVDYGVPMVVYFISNHVVVFLLLHFWYCGSWKKKIQVVFLWMAMLLSYEVMAWFMGNFLRITRYGIQTESFAYMIHLSNDMVAVRVIIGILIMAVQAIFIVFDKCRRKGYKSKKIILLVGVVQMYLVIMAFCYFSVCTSITKRVMFVGICNLFFSGTIALIEISYLTGYFSRMEVEEKVNGLLLTRQKELECYQTNSRHLEEMTLLRHDFVNYLQTVYGMMEYENNYDTISTFLEQAQKRAYFISSKSSNETCNILENACNSISVTNR